MTNWASLDLGHQVRAVMDLMPLQLLAIEPMQAALMMRILLGHCLFGAKQERTLMEPPYMAAGPKSGR